MKPSVFITRRLPESGLRLLRDRFAVSVHETPAPIDRATLKNGVSRAEALICLLSDRIDAEILDCGSRLKIVANYAVGYNNIDIAAARQRKILVTNTPGVLTNATAELAFALIITLTRKILAADRFTRQGLFIGWDPLLLLGDELSGKTLGIVGMGRIGQSLAEKARAFGMSVIYHNRRPLDQATETRLKAAYCPFEALLARADVISIHAPLTEESRHLFDRRAFEKIKPGSFLINTARGEIVDEAALAEALASGRIKGAGLDVYEREPAVTGELMKMDNVVLLPHIGSATVETRAAMAVMAAKNVIAGLMGETPANLIPEMSDRC